MKPYNLELLKEEQREKKESRNVQQQPRSENEIIEEMGLSEELQSFIKSL